MISIRLLFLFVFLLPLPLKAGADLLSVTVPIEGDAPEARRAAMAEALRQVLVKASGQRLAGRGERLQPILERAEEQAQEFRYRSGEEAGGESAGKRLWVRFDRRSVEDDLRRLGLILWEHGRPELVPWVAVERNGRRRLADPERDDALFQVLESAAEQRGLVLVIPLMDLEDRNALGPSDLWTLNLQAIRAATTRYGNALPLVTRVSGGQGRWRARWSLLLPDGERNFESRGGSLQELMEGGVNQAADLLAQRYLPSPAQARQDRIRVRFLGVRDVSDYARLMRLLRSLDVVTGFSLARAEGDRLEFLVRALGGREALVNQLSLIPELAPVVDIPEDEGEESGVETLSYVLR